MIFFLFIFCFFLLEFFKIGLENRNCKKEVIELWVMNSWLNISKWLFMCFLKIKK